MKLNLKFDTVTIRTLFKRKSCWLTRTQDSRRLKWRKRNLIALLPPISWFYLFLQFLQPNPPFKNNLTSKDRIFHMGFSLELPLRRIKCVCVFFNMQLLFIFQFFFYFFFPITRTDVISIALFRWKERLMKMVRVWATGTFFATSKVIIQICSNTC